MMSTYKQKFKLVKKIILSTIFLSTILFYNCGGDESKNKKVELPKVTVAVNVVTPASTLIFIADTKGYWKQEGLDVTIQSFTIGKHCFDALLGGKADFATVAEIPIALAGAQGQKFYVVATILETENDLKIIARKDKGINSPTDLKGKRFAIMVGTTSQFFMGKFLAKYGIKESDVSITNLAPPDMVSAIIRGDVDAVSLWEPHIYNIKKELGDNAVVFPGKGVYLQTFDILIMQDYLTKNEKTVEKFLKGLVDAENFIKKNQDEAITITAKWIGLDKKVLSEIWDNYDIKVVLDDKLPPLLLDIAKWAKNKEILPEEVEIPDYKKFIYTKTLKKVKPNGVTLNEF